ncbi:MAG TPA: autotransporter assembly complex family protein [Alphaproteobacteria bacterium]|nr:autotransporter assembly complex family protein [Alphaproteobacteria bacterium]
MRAAVCPELVRLLFVALAVALATATSALANDLTYETTISVEGEPELEETLRAASLLMAQSDRPPPNELALRRRVDQDAERLRQVLRAEGYYAATLDARLELNVEPAQIRIVVNSGPRYELDRVAMTGPDGGILEGISLTLEQIGLELGQAARSADVLDAERDIVVRLAERGYPLATVPDRTVVVDHARHTMSVTYVVDPGPLARFGRVRIEGTDEIDDQYVRNRLSWEAGDLFDLRQLDESRKRLIRSDLFLSVKIVPDTKVESDGTVPIRIEVVERKPRSVSAGVNWASSEGFGAEASWEHRNLAGHGERLETTVTLSQLLIGANAFLRLPDAVRPDLDFVAATALEKEDTDAFKSLRATGTTGLEQRFNSELSAGLGVLISFEREEDGDGEDSFTLLGLPGNLRYDGTNDPLDPSSGARLSVAATPYYALFAETDTFLRSEATASAYYAIDERTRYVLAARGRLGSIWGAGREELPASIRFYAGGGGSVRGYGFQELGPLDEDDDPQGGRSVIEFGGEMRIRLTETVGIVPFVEGGNVYVDMLPEVYQFDFRYAAGLGLRYYTAIGPLRLDVAVPLNRRESDDAFQFYVSLGQAF